MLCRIAMIDRKSGWRYKCLKLYTERQAEALAARMRNTYPHIEYHVIPATKPWMKEGGRWS